MKKAQLAWMWIWVLLELEPLTPPLMVPEPLSGVSVAPLDTSVAPTLPPLVPLPASVGRMGMAVVLLSVPPLGTERLMMSLHGGQGGGRYDRCRVHVKTRWARRSKAGCEELGHVVHGCQLQSECTPWVTSAGAPLTLPSCCCCCLHDAARAQWGKGLLPCPFH